MNVLEYTKAAQATAMPTAYDRSYLIPKIVGEVGELFGHRAKAVWHGWHPDRLAGELISEYGDIAWGTAILMQLEGTDLAKVDFENATAVTRSHGSSMWVSTSVPDPWQQLQSRAGDLYLYYTQEETHTWLRGASQQMWLALQTHCQAITGATFEDVLQHNLAKLAGRVQRGTLVGQGDHR